MMKKSHKLVVLFENIRVETTFAGLDNNLIALAEKLYDVRGREGLPRGRRTIPDRGKAGERIEGMLQIRPFRCRLRLLWRRTRMGRQ